MTTPDPHLARWRVQLRRGVLEFAVLLALRERERYGFELIELLARRAVLDVPEGTIYPLLLRLETEGLLQARLVPGSGGAARKYYALTARGQEAIAAMDEAWSSLDRAVRIMQEGDAS